ncbi:MAG TPA: hypothetical protein VL463_26400 [Kofleriaceae bacterium]|nr:hypothetical protein [Kofleriaceae bacterium]
MSGPAPDPAGDPAPVSQALEKLHVGPATTLASAVEPARVAFTAKGGAYTGGWATHSARIVDGIVEMTPSTYDRALGATITGGTVTFETAAIGRTDDLVGVGAGTARLGNANTVWIPRGEVVEQIRNDELGVEQSWVFDHAPDGAGDLEIDVGVGAAKLAAANDSGLHFASPGGLGFRYSHGVWRDASGAEYEIQAQWVDDHIKLIVPEGIVSEAKFPATLDPTITAEIFVDNPAIGQTGADSTAEDVASDGSGYFVVWQDRRDTRNDDIWGARVTSAGVVTDTTGLKINTATGVQSHPRVARVTGGYVVAWEDHGGADSNIAAAFVSDAGAVTQLGTVAGTSAQETAPAIVGSGANALLVWQTGTDVMASRYSGSFGAAFAVANGANVEKEPAVAVDGSGNYLVTFTETTTTNGDDVRGQLVASAGTLTGTAFDIHAASGAQAQSAAAFDGTNFIVTWTNATNIYGARVTTAGVVTDVGGKVITSGTDVQSLSRVACQSTGGCFVIWQDRRNLATTNFDIYGAAVASDLTVSAADVVVANAAQVQSVPAIAIGGTQYFAAYTDQQAIEFAQVRGTRITSAGAVSDPTGIVIATGRGRLSGPFVTVVPGVSWNLFFDDSTNGQDIKHVRFNTSGTQLDGTPITISNAAESQISPTAAMIGSTMVATWQDSRGVDRDIYMSRVNTSTGQPLDPAGVAVTAATNTQAGPRIAGSPTAGLIVWQDRRNGATTGFDIYGAIVNASGQVVTTDIPICTTAGDQTRPDVAYDSTNGVFLVVWSDPNGAATNDIRGTRVSTAGAVLDASGVTISGAAGSQFSPALDFSAGQFLVVWEDRRTDSNGDIYAARVKAPSSGIQVLDVGGIAVKAAAGTTQDEPAVAVLNGAFIVAWTDNTNAATTGFDIYGGQVSSTGVVAAPFVISADPEDEHAASLSTGPTSTTPAMIAYTKSRLDIDSQRIQARRISLGTSGGGSCSANSQCQTGFCSDSKCCDTACGGGVLTDCQACSVARGAQVDGQCGIIAGPNLVICRNYAVNPGICDLREYCDGVNPQCPPDVGTNQGRVCTKPGGGSGVCPANDPSGAPHICQ